MNNYIVSPDDCYILLAINNSTSIRGAAKILKCDPSGLIRKVHRISEQHNTLLRKVSGKWDLTAKGIDLLSWMEQSINSQKEVLQSQKKIRVASYSWITEEALIPDFALLQEHFHQTSQISFLELPNYEAALKSSQVDFVISCHPPEDPDITYKRLRKEAWSVIIPKRWEKKFRGLSTKEVLEQLAKSPYIRHGSINHNSIIKDFSFEDVTIATSLDKISSIKVAIINQLGWGIIPRIAAKTALKDKSVVELPINTSINNHFCLWRLRSRTDLIKDQSLIQTWLAKVF